MQDFLVPIFQISATDTVFWWEFVTDKYLRPSYVHIIGTICVGDGYTDVGGGCWRHKFLDDGYEILVTDLSDNEKSHHSNDSVTKILKLS